jgi:hypothetical protein
MRPAEALGAINQTETRHDCDYIMYHRLLCINWLISSGLDKTAWHYTTKDRTLSQVWSNAQRVEVEQSCRYTRQAPLVLSRFSVQSIYRKLGVHEYMSN